MIARSKIIMFTGLLVVTTTFSRAASVLNSKHNLSAGSGNTIRAESETEVCIFCHTPHAASTEAPLWNRFSSGATYTPYSSTTAKAAIGQPTGASKVCLSCHDGTVALGMVRSRPGGIKMQSDINHIPIGRTRIGTDLSDDHPVSFVYDAALASAHSGELRDPSTLTSRVKLDHNNQMQCTSCHDPHDNQFGKFLVQNNTGSALCLTCHAPRHWNESIHGTSQATWNGQGENPWPHSDLRTLAENACDNCHVSHNAGTKPRLLDLAPMEDNCLKCHNGNTGANILAEINKLSGHPIRVTSGIHDPAEDAVNSTRHAACADCHNPHAVKRSTATAPYIPGDLFGVKGVNITGTVVAESTYEYEVCFKCHGDSLQRGEARVTREIHQTNTRMEFSPANASYHPVAAQGKNPNVPSLISPLTTASMIYCTDCHNNNNGPKAGGTGPRGPHGSIYEPLLERQMLLSDDNAESEASYALCYKCHSRNNILADQSFKYHSLHIVTGRSSCTSCHDPHGVENRNHLINFNTLYATAGSNGRVEYVDRGVMRGNCSVTCHGKDHANTAYDP